MLMLSQIHEALLLLFRSRPELAPEVLRERLHVEIPACTEACIEAGKRALARARAADEPDYTEADVRR